MAYLAGRIGAVLASVVVIAACGSAPVARSTSAAEPCPGRLVLTVRNNSSRIFDVYAVSDNGGPETVIGNAGPGVSNLSVPPGIGRRYVLRTQGAPANAPGATPPSSLYSLSTACS